MNGRRRVLVIGLDGMTATSILPIVKDGHMPCVKRLIEEGCSGTLMSVIPPVTGPAWTTFFTGRNPGSHGILDFFRVAPDGMSRRLTNSREVSGKTLWSLLTELGKTLVVVNTPLTYPASPINGAMITGMLTPESKVDMTHPADLYDRLRPELGDYVISVNWHDYNEASATTYLEDLRHCNAQRSRYILRLLDDYDWDFAMATYTGTDRIHHALWHYVDPAERARLGSAYDPAIMEGIHAYFRQLDGYIAQMIEKAGPGTSVFFVSDHGFGPLRRKAAINDWLEQQGLLKIRHGRLRAYRTAAGCLRLAKAAARFLKKNVLKGLVPRFREKAALAANTFYHVFYSSIDWSRTKAYMASNTEQGIYVNLKGREPFGSVDPSDYETVCGEVEEALRAFRDETGKPLMTRCFRRNEVYKGPHTERAPDIIFFLEEGECLAEIALASKQILRKTTWKTGSGMHRLEGFFLAHGPGIKPVPGFCTDLQNVMPTILYSMGLPIPEDLDGKLIAEIFTDEFAARNTPEYAGSVLADAAEGEKAFSDEEEAELQDRLRRLGYMD